jgi:hypothetical protein
VCAARDVNDFATVSRPHARCATVFQCDAPVEGGTTCVSHKYISDGDVDQDTLRARFEELCSGDVACKPAVRVLSDGRVTVHVVTCTPVSFAAVTSADGSSDGDADGGFGGLAKLTAEQVPAAADDPTPSSVPPSDSRGEDGVDAGLIVGIVIAVLLLVGVVMLGILVTSRNRSARAAAATPEATKTIPLQATSSGSERTSSSDRRPSSRRRSRQLSRRSSLAGTGGSRVAALSSTRLESSRT